jgi:hypothetical protein
MRWAATGAGVASTTPGDKPAPRPSFSATRATTVQLAACERGRRPRPRWAKAVVATAVVGALAASQWLGETSGSTRAERRRPLPGDELVDRPTVVTNHAITIPARPDQVWPWLVQMGCIAAAGAPPAGSTGCCSRPTGPAPPDSFPTYSGG